MAGAGGRATPADRVLTLYARHYCHLCEDMRAAVEPLVSGFGIRIEMVDVDADPALEQRYGERVPVLMAGEREICHYHLDRAALDAYLADMR